MSLDRIKEMDMEFILGIMGKNMLEIGKTTRITDRVLNTLKMETNILAVLTTN